VAGATGDRLTRYCTSMNKYKPNEFALPTTLTLLGGNGIYITEYSKPKGFALPNALTDGICITDWYDPYGLHYRLCFCYKPNLD
jgi:hypothetical protein